MSFVRHDPLRPQLSFFIRLPIVVRFSPSCRQGAAWLRRAYVHGVRLLHSRRGLLPLVFEGTVRAGDCQGVPPLPNPLRSLAVHGATPPAVPHNRRTPLCFQPLQPRGLAHRQVFRTATGYAMDSMRIDIGSEWQPVSEPGYWKFGFRVASLGGQTVGLRNQRTRSEWVYAGAVIC
jgi:hypothetical protein